MYTDLNIVCDTCKYSEDAYDHMFSTAYFNYIKCVCYRTFYYKIHTTFPKEDRAYIKTSCPRFIRDSNPPIIKRLLETTRD